MSPNNAEHCRGGINVSGNSRREMGAWLTSTESAEGKSDQCRVCRHRHQHLPGCHCGHGMGSVTNTWRFRWIKIVGVLLFTIQINAYTKLLLKTLLEFWVFIFLIRKHQLTDLLTWCSCQMTHRAWGETIKAKQVYIICCKQDCITTTESQTLLFNLCTTLPFKYQKQHYTLYL